MRTSVARTAVARTAVAETTKAIIAVVRTAVVKTVEVKNTARRGKSFLRKQGIPVLIFFRNDRRLDGAGTLAPTPPLYPFPTWGVNNVFPNL